MDPSRRKLLIGGPPSAAALGLGALPFVIGDRTEIMTPAEARHRGVPLRSLSAGEAKTLERRAMSCQPGAGEAGVVHFVDHHCRCPRPRAC
jgi:hypothetical protein